MAMAHLIACRSPGRGRVGWVCAWVGVIWASMAPPPQVLLIPPCANNPLLLRSKGRSREREKTNRFGFHCLLWQKTSSFPRKKTIPSQQLGGGGGQFSGASAVPCENLGVSAILLQREGRMAAVWLIQGTSGFARFADTRIVFFGKQFLGHSTEDIDDHVETSCITYIGSDRYREINECSFFGRVILRAARRATPNLQDK